MSSMLGKRKADDEKQLDEERQAKRPCDSNAKESDQGKPLGPTISMVEKGVSKTNDNTDKSTAAEDVKDSAKKSGSQSNSTAKIPPSAAKASTSATRTPTPTANTSTSTALPESQPSNVTKTQKPTNALKTALGKSKQEIASPAVDQNSIDTYWPNFSKTTPYTIPLDTWNRYFTRNSRTWRKSFNNKVYDKCEEKTQNARTNAIGKIKQFTEPDHLYYLCIPLGKRPDAPLPVDPKDCSSSVLEPIADILFEMNTNHSIIGDGQPAAAGAGSRPSGAVPKTVGTKPQTQPKAQSTAARQADPLAGARQLQQEQDARAAEHRRGERKIVSQPARPPPTWSSKGGPGRALASSRGVAQNGASARRAQVTQVVQPAQNGAGEKQKEAGAPKAAPAKQG